MFEPDGDAHQTVADTEFGALLRLKPLVRGRRRMRDQALGIAKIIADTDKLERILKTEGGFLAALDLERNKCRAAAHLLLHDGGLRMVGPSGIDQARNLRLFGERDRKHRRA